MKRIVHALSAVFAVSLVYATTLVAEPAPPGGSPPPKADTKGKAKVKAAQTKVEGSYPAEADAKRACGDSAVVWVNTNSKIYHGAGTRDYGKTRRGFYMCQAQADKSGFRAVKGPSQKAKKKESKG